jgi:hypothetical protein
MISSAEEAALMFSKWKTAARLLALTATTPFGVLGARGKLDDFSSEMLKFAGPEWSLSVSLTPDASFIFSDPSEARSVEGVGAYECVILVRLASDYSLMIAEYRDTDGPN